MILDVFWCMSIILWMVNVFVFRFVIELIIIFVGLNKLVSVLINFFILL